MKKFTFSTFYLMVLSILSAQSPGNLNNDVTPNFDFSTVTNTESKFNDARRQEETQLTLGANAIKNLDLPSQAVWDAYSSDQKLLFLLNDERTARVGINYGNGSVKGLPFQGIEAGVDGVAQNYAQTLLDNSNMLDHQFGGTTSGGRLTAAIPLNCREFLPRSENLYASGQGSNNFPFIVEEAVYAWNYKDGPTWGHREMNLLQDNSLNNAGGFTDNNGIAGQEGFVGLGIASGNSAIFPGFVTAVVVLNYYDPVADANAGTCPYNVTVSTNSLTGGVVPCPANVTISAPVMGNTLASASITTQGTVTANTAVFSAPEVNINADFSVPAGQCFEVNNIGCLYTGTLNCEGVTGQGMGTCASPYLLTCGQDFTGDTAGDQSAWDTYGGNGDETGPERIHSVTVPANSTSTVTLSNYNQDLDLFLLTACDNTSVIDAGVSIETTETVTIDNSLSNSPTIYFIVVDGFGGATSAYTLQCN